MKRYIDLVCLVASVVLLVGVAVDIFRGVVDVHTVLNAIIAYGMRPR